MPPSSLCSTGIPRWILPPSGAPWTRRWRAWTAHDTHGQSMSPAAAGHEGRTRNPRDGGRRRDLWVDRRPAAPVGRHQPTLRRIPMTATALRALRFGHSPDADDAFMFYGFHAGLAQVAGCRVEHVLQDIQSLNRRAFERGDLEITAVSAHAYAFVADRYAVLSCGASMGMGYGP